MSSSWGSKENQQLIALLNRLPQPWSPEVFNAMVISLPTTAVETVILRQHEDRIQVHLVERPPEDKYFGGEMHFAGTIVRATDKSYEDAIQRVEKGELNTRFTSVQYVGEPMLIHTKRGTVTELVYVCTIDGEPSVGKFFDVDHLPDNFIEHQNAPLRLAVDYYRQSL